MIFKILEIIFAILGIFVITSIFLIVKKRKKMARRYQETIAKISRLGYDVAFLGNIGAGKTTTAAGYIHALTRIIIGKLYDRLENLRIQLYDTDLNKLQDFYISCLERTQDIYESISLAIKEFKNSKSFKYLYTDFLSIQLREDMLRDYLVYWFVLNVRKNFVFSKGYFYNRVTNEPSMLFDPSSIELRNVLEKYNFQLDIANIIFDEEKSIDRGNVMSNNKGVKLSGIIEFNILLRNMFKELTYKISCKQEVTNDVKLERAGCTGNFDIYDRNDQVCSWYRTRKHIMRFSRFCVFFPKLGLKLKAIFTLKRYDELLEKWQNESNFSRKIEYSCFQLCKWLYSFGYIVIRVRNYYSADNVGKTSRDLYEQIIFTFPVNECYGIVNTWDYACLLEYFQSYSEDAIFEQVSCFDNNAKIDNFIKTLERKKDK